MSAPRSRLARLALVALIPALPLDVHAQQPAPEPAPAEPEPAAEPAPPAEAEPAPAAEAEPAGETAPPPEAAPAPESAPPKPPPYSLPFQLRPVVAGTVIRSDTAIAFFKPDGFDAGGSTIATTLLAAYKVTPEFAPLVRLGFVSFSPATPAGAPAPDSGSGFANPVLGATYALKPSPELRLGLFLGLALPLGSGGGNDPDPRTRAAVLAGIPARSAMDNAMFAMNYFTVFPGVGLAYVAGGFTAQVEVTFLQLTRVKGDNLDTDSSRTNFTTGVHAGYFFIPQLSLGVELRHQRWLSTPQMVEANADARDMTTIAVGPRVHIKLSDTAWFRPAIVYARPLDKPVSDTNMNIVQLDLPFAF